MDGFEWCYRSLRSLGQAYMISYGKTVIAHFQLMLSATLADNYWNVLHVCKIAIASFKSFHLGCKYRFGWISCVTL